MPKTQPKVEHRYLTQEFRVSGDGEAPKISGYAAIFDVPSEDLGWTEVIDPHAFDSVLAANPDTRALWNHNADHVLGRTTANTLHLSIDARGLGYVIDPPDTTVARDLIVSMRRKDVTQSSFGFVCKRDQWTENADGTVTRRILEFDELLDVSPVTYPAFAQATSGIRSFPDSMPAEIRSRFERRSSDEKTKRVDGEDLTSDCFLIVGDPEKTDTWHLPWKFSTDAKTKSHLRDALARIDQVEGVSDADLKAAKAKLLKICKKYGIDTSESKSIRSTTPADTTDQPICECNCAQCVSGFCNLCSDDGCVDEVCSCSNQRSRPISDSERRRMEMRLALLAHR